MSIKVCMDCRRESMESSPITCPVCGGALEELCEACNELVREPTSLLCKICLKEGCGAEITHIVCGNVTEDEDYRLCDSCIAERDDVEPEPDVDDSVKCCPDCEQPNQFGELCDDCRREEQARIEENRL